MAIDALKAQEFLDSIVTDSDTYRDQRLENYRIRQNIDTAEVESDGEQFPWQGAPDHKIFHVDGSIRRKKAVLVQGIEKANVFIDPVEAADVERARAGEQIYQHYWSKIPQRRWISSLTADRQEEKGVAVLGSFWEQELQGYKKTLKIDVLPQDIQMALGVPPEELGFSAEDPQIQQLLLNATDLAVANFLIGAENVSEDQALQVIEDLRNEGVAVFDAIEVRDGGGNIVRKPFVFNENFFVVHQGEPLQRQPMIWTVYTMTQERLMAKVREAGWNRTVAKEIIKNFSSNEFFYESSIIQERLERDAEAGVDNELRRIRDFFDNKGNRKAGLITLIDCYYEDDKDKDLIPEKYLMTYSPFFLEKPLIDESFNYPHGKWPFAIFQREVVDELVASSRGQSQISGSIQESIRIQVNTMDSMSILRLAPPLLYPLGRELKGTWGPLQQIGYRGRPEDFKPLDLPGNDKGTQELITFLTNFDNNYYGDIGPDLSKVGIGDQSTAARLRFDAAASETQQEYDLTNWLDTWTEVYQMEFALLQEFIPDEVQIRIHNNPTAPILTRKRSEIQGKWDIKIDADPITHDRASKEQAENEFIEMILRTRPANVDLNKTVEEFLLRRNQSFARKVLQDPVVPQQKEYEDEMNAFSRILSGAFDPEFEQAPQNANPRLRLGIWERILPRPDVQQRMQADQVFRETIERRVQQWQFQIQQQQNAEIGRRGA